MMGSSFAHKKQSIQDGLFQKLIDTSAQNPAPQDSTSERHSQLQEIVEDSVM